MTDVQTQEALARLQEVLGTRVTAADVVRDHHSRGESYHLPAPPDLVCFPESTAEVSAIVNIARAHGLPIVPFGAGTSLEGHVHAIRGGISVDLTKMNRVLAVRPDDLDATVEAGVTRLQLGKALRNTGLMFPVDPGADATIGGMAATRASGTTAVRYGTMRENVLGLTVVLADGRAIRTGTRARKSSSGYDLTRVFVGSEGTLGVITEVTLRLHPLPESCAAAVCSFADMAGAVATVIATIQLGVPVARIELLDEAQIDAINRYSSTSYPVAPTLFFELHGDPARSRLPSSAMRLRRSPRSTAATAFSGRPGRRIANASGRHGTTRSMRRSRCAPARASGPPTCACRFHNWPPASSTLSATMPARRFPCAWSATPATATSICCMCSIPRARRSSTKHERLNDRLVARALAMGGTCTGEHGIGTGKMKFLRDEHGDALDVMRAIKQAIDPGNLMNPGKVIDL